PLVFGESPLVRHLPPELRIHPIAGGRGRPDAAVYAFPSAFGRVCSSPVTKYPQVPGMESEGERGAGARSVVFRGRPNGVVCAVKLPRVKARWTRWIYREAVALARVKHPLLPAVLEVGAVDELPYLVMELVEGETLAGILSHGRLEEK